MGEEFVWDNIASRTVTSNSGIYQTTGCESLKSPYRKRSSFIFTVLSRAAWVLLYCSGKTLERYGVWIPHELSPYQLQDRTDIHDIAPQLPMALKSYYWR